MKEEKKFNVVPAYGSLFVTCQAEQKTKGGIVVNSMQRYLEDQRVLAIGPECPSWIKVDDIVHLEIEHFAKKKYNSNTIQEDINGNSVVDYIFPIEEVNGQKIMFINARDIKWVVQINDEHYK